MKKTLILSGLLAVAAWQNVPARADLTRAKGKTANSKSWIELTAQLEKSQFQSGQTINVHLTARNTHKSGAYLPFSSGQRFDLQIFPVGKTEPITTWSANKMFAQSLGSLWLKPNQTQTYNAQIGDEMGVLPVGKYLLKAHLTNASASKIEAASVAFEILAPVEKNQISARTDKTTYKLGETVKIDFSVQNLLDKPQTFHFNSGQTYDIFIKNAAGETVWSWGANKRFIMAQSAVEFAAGETKNYSASWDGRSFPDFQAKAGKYSVQAVLKSEPPLESAPLEIEIG